MNPSTTVTTNNPKITRALLSVSDKTGILELAKTLQEMGVEILSTGGTAQLLSSRGIAVTEVSQHTGFPEIMDGRVKTLHPKIHGGILARRDKPEHLNAMTEHHIGPIDLVAVNLYPFENTTAAPEVRMEDAIENIDIGGPAMVRASAKNYPFVTILVDPSDYPRIVDELKTHQGQTTLQTRKELAAKAYAHTSRYDGAIAAFLSSTEGDGNLQDTPKRNAYPNTLTQQWQKVEDLRYGENPHQTAAFYRDAQAPLGLLSNYRQLQGKTLSFNNIADADAAWECVKTFQEPACVIVKHANPCGVAIGVNTLEAYQKALSTDPTSAFGGIVAFNGTVNATTIEAVTQLFVEVLIAPQFDEAALALLAKKPNVRVLQIPLDKTPHRYDLKRVGGGLLVQTPDAHELTRAQCQVVSVKQPSETQWADLLFAWNCAKFIKSNAIVYCKNSMTLGIGAGQMSRIDSARIASIKAEQAGFNLQGSAVASDAFFPFRDGLDVVVDAGAECVIHPGGSIRDEEVITAANERGVVMVFTGVRHFRH